MKAIVMPRIASASRLRTRTGRVESSLENPAPPSSVPRSAIWKKNGRSSVGAEMSASKAAIASPGPSGEASAAKCSSIASPGVSTGVNPSLAASRETEARVASESGSELTSSVIALTPAPFVGEW